MWWLFVASILSIYMSIFQKFDCVITSGPPHVSHIVGLFMKRMSHIRWIMDYRDLWLDDPIQSPQYGYQRKLFESLERQAVKNCDAVVTVSPSWMNQLADKYRDVKDKSRFHMIRNGHNIGGKIVSSSKKAKERLHIHSNGTPQFLSRTTHLLDALFRLKSSGIYDGCLPLVTFTGINDSIRQEIQKRRLEGVVQDVKPMTYQESIEYSMKADVLLVIVNNDHPARRGTIPAKTYEAIGLRKHIFAIIPPRSDVRNLLDEYGNATICNVDDEDDILQCLVTLLESRDKWLERDVTVNTNETLIFKYSRRMQAEQLIVLIESLMSRGPH